MLLVMNVEAQMLFIQRAVTSFVQKAKRIKSAGTRAKARWTPEEWDHNADFAAIVVRVLDAVRATTLGEEHLRNIKSSYISGPWGLVRQQTYMCNTIWLDLTSAWHQIGRDYFHDYEAHLAIKSPDFQLTNLAVWQELVAPSLANTATSMIFGKSGSALNVEEAEEVALEAAYREVVARVAADEKDTLAYRIAKGQADSRKHVLMVQHHRQQNMKGSACGAEHALNSIVVHS